MRSLPLSFLVLDKRPLAEPPPGAVRIIGRPRVYKAHALLLASGATGVKEKRLSKRAFPEQFRALRKGDADVLQIWQCDGDEIVDVQAYP